MESACSSVTSMSIVQSRRRHISENSNIQSQKSVFCDVENEFLLRGMSGFNWF
jgi:hypothetical protein